MGSALVKDCSKSKTRSFVYRSKRSNESLVAVGGNVVSSDAIHRYLILFHNTKERVLFLFFYFLLFYHAWTVSSTAWSCTVLSCPCSCFVFFSIASQFVSSCFRFVPTFLFIALLLAYCF